MNIRRWIPAFIKPFIRYLYYPQERAKVAREPAIKHLQDNNIRGYSSDSKKLIIFFIGGADYDTGSDRISGGIISIVSLCEESRRIKSIHAAEVLMCTLPREHLLAKHTKFENNTDVFRYDQLERYFKKATDILVHIPEYLCNHFVTLAVQQELNWLIKTDRLHLNVLNQNIRLMPLAQEIDQLSRYASETTITTAHQQYCTPKFRELYQVPLHKFSVWISPEKYLYRPYPEKKNLLVVSPDSHPEKESILKKLSIVPGLQMQIIQNLTYEQYKEVISYAKWTLTFGEGLDGYFIEPIFSGAIGFAIYNEDFFTVDFNALPTIYESINTLSDKIATDILNMDNLVNYKMYQQRQFDLCARYYSKEEYLQNIAAFYKKEYTYE
jgi:hypothetical protein